MFQPHRQDYKTSDSGTTLASECINCSIFINELGNHKFSSKGTSKQLKPISSKHHNPYIVGWNSIEILHHPACKAWFSIPLWPSEIPYTGHHTNMPGLGIGHFQPDVGSKVPYIGGGGKPTSGIRGWTKYVLSCLAKFVLVFLHVFACLQVPSPCVKLQNSDYFFKTHMRIHEVRQPQSLV